MKHFKTFIATALFVCGTAFAEPATENSVRELFEVTDFSKSAARVLAAAEAEFNQLMEAAEKGRALSPDDRNKWEVLKNRAREIVRDAFAVEKIEAMHIRLNQEIFTEEEIVAMIEFYKTPAGQAYLKKGIILSVRMAIETKKMMDDTTSRALKMMEQAVAASRGKG